MENYQGTLCCRLSHVGTHSEGRYAYLVTDQGAEYPLCREGAAPFNDPLFDPYDGLRVSMTATLSHGWLVVEELQPGNGPQTESSDETPEPAAARQPDAQEPDAPRQEGPAGEPEQTAPTATNENDNSERL